MGPRKPTRTPTPAAMVGQRGLTFAAAALVAVAAFAGVEAKNGKSTSLLSERHARIHVCMQVPPPRKFPAGSGGGRGGAGARGCAAPRASPGAHLPGPGRAGAADFVVRAVLFAGTSSPRSCVFAPFRFEGTASCVVGQARSCCRAHVRAPRPPAGLGLGRPPARAPRAVPCRRASGPPRSAARARAASARSRAVLSAHPPLPPTLPRPSRAPTGLAVASALNRVWRPPMRAPGGFVRCRLGRTWLHVQQRGDDAVRPFGPHFHPGRHPNYDHNVVSPAGLRPAHGAHGVPGVAAPGTNSVGFILCGGFCAKQPPSHSAPAGPPVRRHHAHQTACSLLTRVIAHHPPSTHAHPRPPFSLQQGKAKLHPRWWGREPRDAHR